MRSSTLGRATAAVVRAVAMFAAPWFGHSTTPPSRVAVVLSDAQYAALAAELRRTGGDAEAVVRVGMWSEAKGVYRVQWAAVKMAAPSWWARAQGTIAAEAEEERKARLRSATNAFRA